MTFLKASLDLLTGKSVATIGPEQYADHRGLDRHGNSMSGALLWARAEAARLETAAQTGTPNMVDAERRLAKTLARRAPKYVGKHPKHRPSWTQGITVVDNGPGTLTAFTGKTLPVARALHAERTRCVLVDRSAGFLTSIRNANPAPGIAIDTVQDDIFAGHRHLPDTEVAFILMLGRTFGNIPAPISEHPPQSIAVDALRHLANGARHCWLAVSIGADLDPRKAKAYYESHPEFQLNVFYRMQAELPVDDRFDPEAFAYEAHVTHSDQFLQVAHLATVQRDITFAMTKQEICLKAGQQLHLKNSFCFAPAFLQECARLAGLRPIDLITDGKGSDIHVFEKVPPPLTQPAKQSPGPVCHRRVRPKARIIRRSAKKTCAPPAACL